MFAVAVASNFNGFLVGLAISGLGFGIYAAVDLALVADVLPSKDNVAKDLGLFNIGGGNYGVLYAAAGIFAIIGAVAILPVRGVR
jgi:MFS family permease